jgi:uncharacterized damage-inducible protein DinB
MRKLSWVLVGCCLILLTTPLRAQEKPSGPGGFLGEYLGSVNDAEKKLLSLAEAEPQEKYSWRPGDGVRSISEVYVHVAMDNYYFLSLIGQKPPAIERDAEKTVTEKEKVIKYLKDSFEWVKSSVANVKDDELEKATKMFGRMTTTRNVLLVMATHMHEHLGQSIAYARTNGIVPPWSMPAKGTK